MDSAAKKLPGLRRESKDTRVFWYAFARRSLKFAFASRAGEPPTSHYWRTGARTDDNRRLAGSAALVVPGGLPISLWEL